MSKSKNMDDAQAPTTTTSAFRIAVLASGTGSNLQAIIDAVHGNEATVVAVASDKRECMALDRARDAGIATESFPADEHQNKRAVRDAAIGDYLDQQRTDLIVLAGYMQLLSPQFIQRFEHRIINVHPSLLPKYPGLKAIEQALEAGESETGVTVHFVDEGIDTGPAIAQERVAIEPHDTAETLAERIHAVEHRLLPSVIRSLARAAAGSLRD
jgi:phosphoribosylglycinamide formyltransferase-1